MVLHRICLAAVVASMVASVVPAQAQAPKITAISPAALQPGKSVDLTISGTDLNEPTAWWTNVAGASGSARVELAAGVDKNGTLKDRVVARVTVPSDAPLGVYGLRLATARGVSNLRLVMVDDLNIVQQSSNTTPKTAQDLQLPVTVEGACAAESFHYFRFRVAAGERISVDVWARRLGSALDPVVRLLDGS